MGYLTGPAALDAAVAVEVGRGGRVESRTESQAVVVIGARPNHVLHFLISVLTCGLWVVVWAFIAALGGERRVVIGLDPVTGRAFGDLSR